MASLAALYDWLLPGKTWGKTEDQRSRGGAEDCRIRALPKEDIHLFVKRIPNENVVPLVDRRDMAASVNISGVAMLVAILLVVPLLPRGFNTAMQHEIQELRSERRQLVNKLNAGRALEAKITSSRNMQEWAGTTLSTPRADAIDFAPPAAAGNAVARRLSGR